nr:surfeit locus protein 1 [Onthophagus taurus]
MNSSKLFNIVKGKYIRKIFTSNVRFAEVEIKSKPNLRLKEGNKRDIGPFGWFLLSIPAGTFALGTWQIQRKKWKEALINNLQERKNAIPITLPDSLEELESLEYYPIHVKGQFLHDKEMYMGPRSLLIDGDAASKSSLLSKGQTSTQGYLVVTPFKLSDRDETILVNRGWVPTKSVNPKSRPQGQVEGEVDVIGVVRLHENRPTFMPKNKEGTNIWYYRDLEQMCAITGASPIFLDATNEFDVKGGPIGGQTRISLRNEHLSYILTWYGLCAFTSIMWYRQFLKPV